MSACREAEMENKDYKIKKILDKLEVESESSLGADILDFFDPEVRAKK